MILVSVCHDLTSLLKAGKNHHGTKQNLKFRLQRALVRLTSLTLACSEFPTNVPYKQLYRWSRIVISIDSLNSNAVGNCKMSRAKHHNQIRETYKKRAKFL